ncbi:GATA type zinc finger transcription factor family protein [Artemisia annua]|uniref:GATA type zinc finger transcription factor family protein n=1 Tax=Artemisia annua TaxID=35608 RepID=A0A2U1Q0R0_ARTAN|nr:GATA type zinc finger transcription factor family protein [Artemisia annua]
MDGVLYCKTHFEQLFKESGNFSKNFQTCNVYFRFLISLPIYTENPLLYNKPYSRGSNFSNGTYAMFIELNGLIQIFAAKQERDNSMTRAPTPNKLSSLFCGTQDKCRACNKTVYPLEKMTMEGEPYHKSCFKCAHGGCPLTHSSYAALDGILYCKHHFAQLFMEKGTYSHVLEAANKKNVASSQPEPPTEDEAEQPKEEEENELSNID